MIIRGRVLKLGDNIDTDLIIPGRYLQITDFNELKKHVFEDLGKEIAERVKEGTIIVAGENFGCGSSREHAPRVLKAAGVSAVIAKSFARIFFRNAINIGLPIFVSKDFPEKAQDDSEIEIDTKEGVIRDLTSSNVFYFEPYPEFLENLINSGGLVNFVRSYLSEKERR
ncbi:MAG TPA: 3-isopropylmalate dehydratase small subunit [Euryarchaeota archaeon]|nr:3-isopropylmalate dehydratase small subunit [Euryarchaeota archaeon]